MTSNAQAALLADYGCRLIEARAEHFLTWLDAKDKETTQPVVVPPLHAVPPDHDYPRWRPAGDKP